MDEQFRGKDGQPMYFTKENVTEMYGPGERKKIEVFEELQRSLSPQQVTRRSRFFIHEFICLLERICRKQSQTIVL